MFRSDSPCPLRRAALLALLCLAATSPSPSSEHAWTGHIVVSIGDGETADIHVLSPDGTARRLTSDGARNLDPVWSPDGTRIAFVSRSRPSGSGDLAGLYSTADLCVMDAQGRGLRRLTAFAPSIGPEIGRPAWSPDGRNLVFSHGSFTGGGDLYCVAADGSDLRTLTASDEHDDRAPCWSPDGTEIAFERWREEGSALDQVAQLWLVDAAGGAPQRLVEGEDPAWSPAGRRLAFVIRGGSILHDESYAQVATVDAESFDVRRIGPTFATIGRLAWAPDGRSLALVGRREHRRGDTLNALELELRETQSLHLLDADGSQVRSLSPARASAEALSWSPDGERLCFASRSGEDLTFRVIDLSGNEQRVELGSIALGATCDWAPEPQASAAALAGRWRGEVRILDRVFPLELEIGDRAGAPWLLAADGPQVPGAFTGDLARAEDGWRRTIGLAPSATGARFFATWTLRLTAPDRLRLEQRIAPDRPRSDGPAFPVYELLRADS